MGSSLAPFLAVARLQKQASGCQHRGARRPIYSKWSTIASTLAVLQTNPSHPGTRRLLGPLHRKARGLKRALRRATTTPLRTAGSSYLRCSSKRLEYQFDATTTYRSPFRIHAIAFVIGQGRSLPRRLTGGTLSSQARGASKGRLPVASVPSS